MGLLGNFVEKLNRRFFKQDLRVQDFPDVSGESQEEMIHRVLLAMGFVHTSVEDASDGRYGWPYDGRFDYYQESNCADNYVQLCPDHLYVKIYAKNIAHTDSDIIPLPIACAQELADQVRYHTCLD